MKILFNEICLKEIVTYLCHCKDKSISTRTLYHILGKHFTLIQIKECLLELLKNECVSCIKNRWIVKDLSSLETFMKRYTVNMPNSDCSQKIAANTQSDIANSSVLEDTNLLKQIMTDVYPEKIIPSIENGIMSIQCPQCHTSFPIVPEYMGMKVECGNCTLNFYIASKIPFEIEN